jgi:hypothetical protein
MVTIQYLVIKIQLRRGRIEKFRKVGLHQSFDVFDKASSKNILVYTPTVSQLSFKRDIHSRH